MADISAFEQPRLLTHAIAACHIVPAARMLHAACMHCTGTPVCPHAAGNKEGIALTPAHECRA